MADASFWDRIAPRYAARPVSDPDAYEATLARVKTYLKDTDRALELGCGTGSTALRLAPFVAEYEGTDLSQAMIDIALDKAWSASEPNLVFRVAGADAAALSGQNYDAVLAFNLLHLLPDADATLSAIRALLPEGGIFISKTPCIGAKWYYRPLVLALRAVGKAPDLQFLKVDDVDRMIAAAGFEIVETGLYPPSLPSRFVVARKL